MQQSIRKAILINSMTGGGAEKVVAVLVEQFVQLGEDFELICLEKNNFFQLKKKINYLSELTGKEPLWLKLIMLFVLAYRLKKIVKTNQITVVQSHLYRANYVNILSGWLGSKHNIQIVNHGSLSRFKHGLISNIKTWFVKTFYTKVNLIITPSYGMKNEIQVLLKNRNRVQYPDRPMPQIIVIPNPFDLEKIKRKAGEKVSEQEFVFDNHKQYLISIGRLIDIKRHDDLIHAFYEIHKEFPQTELIFLGAGDRLDYLKTIVSQRGLERSVWFLGQVDNPYKYLSRCHVLILTSSSEGFANVIVEALACNVPVVSTDCPSGPREILAPDTDTNYKLKANWELASYGVLVPVGCLKELAAAIKLILSDEKLVAAYRQKAIDRINSFDAKAVFAKYKKTLELNSQSF
jgi:N-acetylgalactosamine-N,N'-diacetylbacillosaminyl-diphospho-undecaprenol 4-alpha-N-acetylgalactosaminyltransferase